MPGLASGIKILVNTLEDPLSLLSRGKLDNATSRLVFDDRNHGRLSAQSASLLFPLGLSLVIILFRLETRDKSKTALLVKAVNFVKIH